MRVKGGLGIIGALLVVSSARAQKVETQYDRNADFSSYKTYAWRQERLLTQLSKENQARVKHRWLVPSTHNCRRKVHANPERAQFLCWLQWWCLGQGNGR
jgi:hypothetical protein